MRPLRVERLGVVPYGEMLERQRRCHESVAAGGLETLFILQHEPVVTLGRNSGDRHLLVNRSNLEERGIALHETERGGDITYHGPGQLVGYPILRLPNGARDVRGYVYQLEEIMIRCAADFGVVAERVEGLRGIWVGDAKIGAVGVRISRGASLHGFAINVTVALDAFSLIVPCGLAGRSVTSLAACLAEEPPLNTVEDRLVARAVDVLGDVIRLRK